ncbi:MAG: hypothetical protein RL385_2399 [Pseudomonadota bacterium]
MSRRKSRFHVPPLDAASLPSTIDHAGGGGPSVDADAARFAAGTLLASRYRIARFLGRGATGAVFQAVDESRGSQPVAVKLLLSPTHQALVRLKNEFRALVGLRHPQLVAMQGLHFDQSRWFVVMDLVEQAAEFPGAWHGAQGVLRQRLTELLTGVQKLHAEGKVHRDLKPSNVLVDTHGHVFIVDFGLVGPGEDRNPSGGFAGTPAYAAPEQVSGEAVGPKSDLYAVGVMLYEALTGALPGSTPAMPLHTLPEGVLDAPRDLVELCDALLQPSPAERPTPEEALDRLRVAHPTHDAAARPSFVSRTAERLRLADAARHARTEGTVLALVLGERGVGKTRLLEQFQAELVAAEGTLVLGSRCYVQEHVPFKAFDALMDGLLAHLNTLTDDAKGALYPEDVGLLGLLFPALSSVFPAPRIARVPADDARSRLRAFRALRSLLARLSAERPLLLYFDDLQWTDEDSLQLLHTLLEGPEPGPGLVVCTLRSEDADSERVLDTLRALTGIRRIELPLAGLAAEDASHLLDAILPDTHPEDRALLVRESRGNPYWIQALAMHALRSGHVTSISEVARAQCESLSAEARGLVELLAISGRPTDVDVAAAVFARGPLPIAEALGSSLAMFVSAGGREQLHTTHDIVRETILAALDETSQRSLHGKLADVLAQRAHVPADQVAGHFLAACRPGDARPYLLRAAAGANRAFAFARAAELYATVLHTCPSADDGPVAEALADVQARRGHVLHAAQLYEQAALATPEARKQRSLASRAMLLRMLGGDFEGGNRQLESLCVQLGVPPMPRATLPFWIACGSLALRYLAGGKLRGRPLPAQEAHHGLSRERVALLRHAAQGTAHSSAHHGIYYGLQTVLHARKHRDRRHWPFVQAWEIAFRTGVRGVSDLSDDRDMAHAIALAEENGDDELLAITLVINGVRLVYTARHREGGQYFARAEELVATRQRSMVSVHNSLISSYYSTWMCGGRIREMMDHSVSWLVEARATGNLWSELIIRVMGSYGRVASDDVAGAREDVKMLRTPVGRSSWFWADPWWFAEPAQYEGDYAGALAACDFAREAPSFWLVHRSSSHRAWFAYYEARAHLGLALQGHARRHRQLAAHIARALRRESSPAGPAVAAHIDALIAVHEGRRAEARRALQRAITAHGNTNFHLLALALRHRLGLLQGGAEGDATCTTALQEAAALGVVRPLRWFQAAAPVPG